MRKRTFSTRVSNVSGFYLRAIESPVNSSHFRTIREQLRAIPIGNPIYNHHGKKGTINTSGFSQICRCKEKFFCWKCVRSTQNHQSFAAGKVLNYQQIFTILKFLNFQDHNLLLPIYRCILDVFWNYIIYIYTYYIEGSAEVNIDPPGTNHEAEKL